jgi:hypothetical protein
MTGQGKSAEDRAALLQCRIEDEDLRRRQAGEPVLPPVFSAPFPSAESEGVTKQRARSSEPSADPPISTRP